MFSNPYLLVGLFLTYFCKFIVSNSCLQVIRSGALTLFAEGLTAISFCSLLSSLSSFLSVFLLCIFTQEPTLPSYRQKGAIPAPVARRNPCYITSVDFVTGLPKNQKQNDSIMVVVDKLSKGAHIILVKTTYTTANIADIFMKEIFRLHGIPNGNNF